MTEDNNVPKVGDSVSVTARHWYQDPIVRICILQFLVMLGVEYQNASQNQAMTFATFISLIISAIVAVIKAQAPEVVTGLKLFDKPVEKP